MKTRKITASRRGITIVEVTVALAVIVLVSAATMGLVLRASEVERKTANAIARNEQVENVTECYQWADGDAAAFGAALLEVGYSSQGDGSYRFDLTASDSIEVSLQIEENELTGIKISGPNIDEDIHYG